MQPRWVVVRSVAVDAPQIFAVLIAAIMTANVASFGDARRLYATSASRRMYEEQGTGGTAVGDSNVHAVPYQGQQENNGLGSSDRHLVVDERTGIQYNPYSKHHPGRHVCTSFKNLTQPAAASSRSAKQTTNCKPVYKKYFVRCGNQWCASVKVEYETAHKDVTLKSFNDVQYSCCPGWTQVTNRSHGCNKPVCPKPCLNGGKCVKPGLCSCPRGFIGTYCERKESTMSNDVGCVRPCQNGGTCNTARGMCTCPKGYKGSYCEKDVDECKEMKPCDQICYNNPGSFTCQCREDFVLQKDGQSCRKEDYDGSTSFEAKDLEFETLDKRLLKLETMMGESHKNEVTKNDINLIYKDINNITSSIKDLSKNLANMEFYKRDIYHFKNKLNQIEKKANKIDDLLEKYEKMKKCAFYNKICI